MDMAKIFRKRFQDYSRIESIHELNRKFDDAVGLMENEDGDVEVEQIQAADLNTRVSKRRIEAVIVKASEIPPELPTDIVATRSIEKVFADEITEEEVALAQEALAILAQEESEIAAEVEEVEEDLAFDEVTPEEVAAAVEVLEEEAQTIERERPIINFEVVKSLMKMMVLDLDLKIDHKLSKFSIQKVMSENKATQEKGIAHLVSFHHDQKDEIDVESFNQFATFIKEELSLDLKLRSFICCSNDELGTIKFSIHEVAEDKTTFITSEV
jgi:hypothetical protein